jgi:hypothetical protein
MHYIKVVFGCVPGSLIFFILPISIRFHTRIGFTHEILYKVQTKFYPFFLNSVSLNQKIDTCKAAVPLLAKQAVRRRGCIAPTHS